MKSSQTNSPASAVSVSLGSVREDLRLWGPEATFAPLSLRHAELYCKTLATTHYENFPVVTWLLPRYYRQPFYNVYAFCRWADDLGDEIGNSEESSRLLHWWNNETMRCFSGEASHPVFVALLESIREFSLQRKPFLDLISAFQQDQTVTTYQTFDQLLDYCTRSANPVGRILLRLLNRDSEQNLFWSDSICTGLQLANFWQDVRRDSEIGRIYLPLEDLREFHYTPEQLQNLAETPEFLKLMEFEVCRARKFLKEGLPLGRSLPGRTGLEIELFARGGLLILDRIAQQKYRVLTSRPKLGKTDFVKLSLSLFRRLLPL